MVLVEMVVVGVVIVEVVKGMFRIHGVSGSVVRPI